MIDNEIIELFDNEKEDEILKLLTSNPDLVKDKTEDGWSLIQLASYYNTHKLFKAIIDKDNDALLSDNTNPLMIALEEGNNDIVEIACNSLKPEQLRLNTKEKSGENLLHLAILKGNNQLAKKLYSLGVSCFEKNNQGDSAFTEIIKQGNVELFDYFNEYTNLKDNFEEVFVKKCIQYDRAELLERIYPMCSINKDALFDLAAGFGAIKSLNIIMQSGEVIPGREQVMKIIDIISKKYETQDEVFASTNLADYLFAIKVPFNQFVNDRGQSAWMLCIQNNNEEVFERLMATAENVNISDREDHSPLFYAIEKNNINMVKILLKKKANPNHKDKNNNTPLIKAVENGNSEIVTELLKYCHNVNDTNINNEHALSIAIKKRRMDIVGQLIWSGGEITTNPVKFIEEKHMFHFGADGEANRFAYHEEEQIDNFVALSKLGFKLDQTNEEGDSFLIHFIKNGYISNFSAIMRCQINPNQTDNEGNTALMCAANKKQNEYFNAILRKFSKIDYQAKNNNNETVYDICARHQHIDRLEQLIKVDPNYKDINLSLFLKLIAKEGNFENINKEMISAKNVIDFNHIDENGNNLIMYSLAGGNIKNIKWLIENTDISIDINRTNKFGNSIKNMIEAIPNQEISREINGLVNKYTKKP